MNHFAWLFPDHPCHPVFDRGKARIAQLEGIGECYVFLLDWSKCDENQRRQVARIAVEMSRRGTVAEFLRYMNHEAGDMPIRANCVRAVTGTPLAAFL